LTVCENLLIWRIENINFKKSFSTGALLIGVIGLFGIESVSARNYSDQPSSSYTIAQNNSKITDANSPIYGTYKLTYSVDGIVYESTLVMSGYSGVMRTRYCNPNTSRTEVVRQNITLKSIPSGLFFLVVGDAGNDILLGTNQFSRGKGEFDVLVGGANNDSFVLGDRSGSYYGFGNGDYAQISNLSGGDVIQLGIGETYFARRDAAGFDLFVARGSAFDLVADVRTTFNAGLPAGTFKLASGQSLGIFLGA
jgi:hypothetical protein